MNTAIKILFAATMLLFLVGAVSLVAGIVLWTTQGFSAIPFIIAGAGFAGYVAAAVAGSRLSRKHIKENRT